MCLSISIINKKDKNKVIKLIFGPQSMVPPFQCNTASD